MKLEPRFPDEIAQDERELLDRRAARLREKPRETEEESVLWAAEFPVGEDSYALPLDTLRAAVPLKMVTPVPLSPPHVIGILRFQGQILTAMSLSSLLGGRGWREAPAVLLGVDPGLGGRRPRRCSADSVRGATGAARITSSCWGRRTSGCDSTTSRGGCTP